LYDITKISGKNRAGKSNILFAIVNVILGTNLTGDEKACLINKKCDASYTELHFTDNQNHAHILIRGKHKFDNKKNFISLDGKIVTQIDLMGFFKDKKLLLSILNPFYFLSKRPSEQKEMVDKYISDIKPKTIFDKLNAKQQNDLIEKYFYVSTREIYTLLNIEELELIYNEHKLQLITGKEFTELSDNERKDAICGNIKTLKNVKYYEMLTPKEKENFINLNMPNIFMDIAYNNLSIKEQEILEGIPRDIPTYIYELNQNIKASDQAITSLNGKIEYAQNIVNEKLSAYKKFEKDIELSLARQELAFLMTNQNIINKERQKKIVNDLEKDILNKETEIIELEKSMKEGKKEYLQIKNGTIVSCPTCGQHIADTSKVKTIENMKKSLTNDYNRRNLLDTEKKDLNSKLIVERCKYHALEGETTIEKNKQIAVIKDKIEKLENEQLEIEKYNNEIKIKENNIKNAKLDIKEFNKEILSNQSLIDSSKKAKQIAQKLYITYIEEKMKLAKQYLKDVNIKFYSVLKTTGEIKDDFIITYKDSPLADLSRSETIATAMEFANMFNKIGRLNLPLFIDDYESCADYNFVEEYSKDSQVIVSQVAKGHNLTIADANSDNCTIIKPTIIGFRTMNIHKNNVANIRKAA
jgi:DNA repair exonuclease SbcCD ATPase subunit